MTPPAEAAVTLDDEPLDLSGFEAKTEKPKTMPAPLMALYRLRAAALQMIANENDREAEAARERLELDKKIHAQTTFDWSRPVVA